MRKKESWSELEERKKRRMKWMRKRKKWKLKWMRKREKCESWSDELNVWDSKCKIYIFCVWTFCCIIFSFWATHISLEKSFCTFKWLKNSSVWVKKMNLYQNKKKMIWTAV